MFLLFKENDVKIEKFVLKNVDIFKSFEVLAG